MLRRGVSLKLFFTKNRGEGRGFSWQQSLVLFLFFFYDSNVELTVF